ncbi:MAG: metallopeptidase family protein [Candidatus Omnitrophota bacterium]|jgi:predicted Zn-dependent protease with MMP-like domain|nr:MAG: metallopeptidase family protein [Candidatus Omnitrophota bacterium]
MTEKEIIELVDEILDELPPDVRHALEQVTVTIQDYPTREQLSRLRGHNRHSILGLYEGTPFPHQTFFSSPIYPPAIILFKKNIERYANSPRRMKDEVQRTLLHEIGHHLGLDETDLRKRGL